MASTDLTAISEAATQVPFDFLAAAWRILGEPERASELYLPDWNETVVGREAKRVVLTVRRGTRPWWAATWRMPSVRCRSLSSAILDVRSSSIPLLWCVKPQETQREREMRPGRPLATRLTTSTSSPKRFVFRRRLPRTSWNG